MAVPVHEEPRHRLVHESPGLRLLDIRIPAGDVSLFHSHVDPTLYVTLEDAPIATQRPDEDWEQRTRPRAVGEVTDRCDYFTDPLVHRVRNDGSGLFHLLGVVNTDAGEHGLVPAPDAELANQWFVVRRSDGSFGDGPSETTRVFVDPGLGSWLVVPAGERVPRQGNAPTLEIQIGSAAVPRP